MGTFTEISSFSIALPILIGIFRFKESASSFKPFFLLMLIALVAEILSYIIVNRGYSNAVVTNVYVLIESALILWQFKKWGFFRSSGIIFPILLALFLCAWLLENFIISNIKYFSSYFRIIYSFILVLLSITMINKLVIGETKSLLYNSIFLACCAFIIFFTYKVLVEIFWLSELNSSPGFRKKVYDILVYVNLFTNLIYALVILWIPRKQKFIQPS